MRVKIVKGDLMRKFALPAVFAVAFAASAAFATDGTWNYESTATPDGLTIESAASWDDSENWVGGIMPSGSTGCAFLVDKNRTTSMSDYTRYIRIPAEGVTVAGVGSRQGANIYIVGGPLGLSGTTPSMGYAGLAALRDETSGFPTCPVFWHNESVTFHDATLINRCNICAPIHGQGNVSVGDQFRHLMNFYAPSASETIVDESHTGHFSVGSGGIYVHCRMGAARTVGYWRTKSGSPYLVRVGAVHDLAPGCGVSGAGIPSGAFLRRVFSDSLVEISAPATADSADATTGTEIEFAAYSPKTVQHLQAFDPMGGNPEWNIAYTKDREEDEFLVYIDKLSCSAPNRVIVTIDTNQRFSLDSDKTTYPATVFFKDVSGVPSNSIHLTKADVMFRPVVDGDTESYVRSVALDGTAKVTVSNGFATTFGDVSAFSGSIKKAGGGLLTAYTKLASFGTIDVAEGEFAIAPTGGVATVSSLSVASGATLSLAEGTTLAISSMNLANGATVRIGKGAVLRLPGSSFPSGVTFEGEGSVDFSSRLQSANYGEPVFYASQYDPGVKGTPAFWITAESLTNATPAGTLVNENGTNFVARWNDCRGGADAGYHFATNLHHKPYVAPTTNAFGQSYVKINGAKDSNNYYGLVWDEPIRNIRTVFAVIDITDGYGSILGSTPRLAGVHYLRGSRSNTAGLFYRASNGACGTTNIANVVLNVPVYLDGVEVLWNTNLVAVGGTGVHVIEVDALGDTEADAFAVVNGRSMWQNRPDLAGGERVYEYIIYTNALTFAERYNTCAYLVEKYRKSATPHQVMDSRTRIDSVAAAAVATHVPVASGAAVGVTSMEEGAKLRKTGDGTLYLTDLANASGALSVEGGTAIVHSRTNFTRAAGAYLHLDATDASTITTKEDSARGMDVVTTWRDPDSGREAKTLYSSSTNLPFMAPAALNGLDMIDFGPAIGNISSAPYTKASTSSALTFTGVRTLRTVFSVLGTAGGGGSILGGDSGRNDPQKDRIQNKTYLGLWRDVQTHPTEYSMPLIIGTWYRDGYGTSNNMGTFVDTKKTEVRLNGEVVNPTSTGFTGGYDLVSVRVGWETMEANTIGGIHYANQVGGQQIGELAYYERLLPQDEFDDTQAYFMKRWFNRSMPRRRAATIGTLSVANGATLVVEGGAPLTVGSFSGGGSVSGAVTFLADADWTFEAKSDGTIAPLSVAGALDISAGGTVHVTGDTGALNAGMYTLMTATSISAGELGAPVIAPHVRHRGYSYALVSDATSVSLKVTAPGMVIRVD